MDSQIGRLLDVVEELGCTDRTLVIAVADHGEGLGQHGEKLHGTLVYDSTMHVPMVMACGRSALGGGVYVPGRLSVVDIKPTVLSLLGIEPNAPADGIDLTGPDPGRRLIFCETLDGMLTYGYAPLLAAYDGRFKYIHGPDPELYDLSADPFETKNLLSADPVVAGRMRDDVADVFGPDLEQLVAGLSTAPTVQQSAADLAKLEALGYVGGSLEAALRTGPRPDPKKMILLREQMTAITRRAEKLGYDKTVSLLEKIADQHPEFTGVHTQLARLHTEHGRLDRAEAALRRCLDTFPDAPDILLQLASARGAQGDYVEAAALCRRILEVYPDHMDALYKLGSALLAQGRTDDAVEPLKAAFRLLPADDGIRQSLLQALKETGRTEEAIVVLSEALQAQPGLSVVREALLQVLLENQRYVIAEDVLREGLRHAPDDPELPRRLAELLATCPEERFRDPAEAVAIMERACAAVPTPRPEDLLTLAVAYMADGKPQQAVSTAEKALASAEAARATELVRTISTKLSSFRAAAANSPNPPPPPGGGSQQ